MPTPTDLAERLARRLLPEAEHRRLDELRYDRGRHGFDPFGLHSSWVGAALGVYRPLYEGWFRVQSAGVERLPQDGPAILVANHGGMLPFDGMMLWCDVLKQTRPPRVLRVVADHFVPALPFIGTIFSRGGVVAGSRGNVHRLLERDELVLIFPEGTPGIGKPITRRYQLQAWRVGHAEMAIRHRAPVVPVAIVGPDEQMPLTVRLPIKAFGAPWLPVPVPPLPLPVRYRITYGAPIHLHQGWRPADADSPAAVAEAAEVTRVALQRLLDRCVAERPGIFR